MRNIINKLGFPVYWIIALVDMFLIYSNLDDYRYYTKPYLVPVLAIAVFSKIGFAKHIISKVIILLAFVAATFGDIFLLKSNGFISGLMCFAVVLLFYTIYLF